TLDSIVRIALEKRKTPVKTAQQAHIKRKIRIGVIEVAAKAIALKFITKRPWPSQRRAALKKIEKAANKLVAAIDALDIDSYQDLRGVFEARVPIVVHSPDASLFTRPPYQLQVARDLGIPYWTPSPYDGTRQIDAILAGAIDLEGCAADAQIAATDI